MTRVSDHCHAVKIVELASGGDFAVRSGRRGGMSTPLPLL